MVSGGQWRNSAGARATDQWVDVVLTADGSFPPPRPRPPTNLGFAAHIGQRLDISEEYLPVCRFEIFDSLQPRVSSHILSCVPDFYQDKNLCS